MTNPESDGDRWSILATRFKDPLDLIDPTLEDDPALREFLTGLKAYREKIRRDPVGAWNEMAAAFAELAAMTGDGEGPLP